MTGATVWTIGWQWLVTDTFPTDSVLPTIREEFAKLP